MKKSCKRLLIALLPFSVGLDIGCSGGASRSSDDDQAGSHLGGDNNQLGGAASFGGSKVRGGESSIAGSGTTTTSSASGEGGTSTGETSTDAVGGAGGTAADSGFGGTSTGGTSSGSAATEAAPSHLRVNDLLEPFDLDVLPHFGWQVTVAEQTAYEIRVSSTREKAEALVGDVWATGKVSSKAQNAIVYGGPALGTSERYFWRVRVWNANDRASEWAKVTAFGSGPGATWSHSKPIWALPVNDNFTDYTLTSHLTINEVALGLRFRAPDSNNGYMWQFRGSDNRLVPHRLQNGTFNVIETVTLPTGTLTLGKEALVRIEAVGATLRTYIGGVLVHAITDSTFSNGGFGVRTGSTESGALADFTVVATNGQTLLQTDFTTGDLTFSCGTVSSGALQIPKSATCLTRGFNADWAFLRKDFTLANRPIAWATLHATASSPLPARQYVYKLNLNGTFVGLGPTRSIASETRYDGFDVTSLLKAGQSNTLGCLAFATKGQAFQAELIVEYVDGTREYIGTDKTWKGRSGDYAFPAVGSIGTSYYVAPKEHLDAREFPYGFDSTGFVDDTWTNAGEKAAFGTLVSTPTAKVKEQLKVPVQIIQKASGNYFIDFGRTWIGGIQYQVDNGKAGDTVKVRFGEITSAPNTVKYQLNTGNTYEDVYTLTGGAQRLQTWGMRVFRYVEILGAPELVTAENLKALALVYPFDTAAATFTASDTNLTQVWQLSKNTIEAVNVNFYTDSWTRERANYEADAYLQQLSNLYLTDDPTLGRYSIEYFKSNRTWPTEWPLYVILAVYEAWQKTGETQPLEAMYSSLVQKLPEAWFESATNLVRKDSGSNGCSSSTDCDIVDWPQTQRDGYVYGPYNTVLNALSYRAYRVMAEMATATSRIADAATYTTRADALRAAMNARLYSAAIGGYDDGLTASGTPTGHYSLHASGFALAFGVPDVNEVPKAAAYVASRGMACSVYGAAFVVDALFQANNGGAALALLGATGTTSWMNMIQDGAGATAEAWDASLKNNLTYSHPWAASPAFLIPSGLFGIRPLEPGYAKFRVEPHPGSLEEATVTVPTVRGKIGAAFSHSSTGAFQLAVLIPGNSNANIRIPVSESTTATLYVNGDPQLGERIGGDVELKALGTGCYIITTEQTPLSLAEERLLELCNESP